MKSLVAQFILRLQDRTSAGLGALQQRLQGLAQMARRVALIGGIGAGLSLAGPIQQAAGVERIMRETAITAGLTGAEVERMISRNLEMFQGLARETNQRVQDIAASAGILVAGGGEAGSVWEQLVPTIARAATASGASAADLSQTVLAMVNNLKLAPGEVEQALATMIQAGREGQFELRDMAREFAGLTAAASGIGLTGPRAVSSLAAALQIARRGAGTAGEAATNLQNILQKMVAPDAVDNFRDFGVDIEAVMSDASRRGINPLEALVQKLREVTGGNMFRVSELFADGQVLAFLRPMIQQTQEYIDTRDRAAAAPVSLIDQGQADAMRGLDAALKRITIGLDEFSTRAGMVAVGPLQTLGEALFWVSDRIKAFEGAFPGVIGHVTTLAAGALALSAGIGAAGFVLGPLAGVVAALASPIGLAAVAVAGLAFAAWQIYENWSGIAAWFTGQWQQLRTGMQPQVDMLLGFFHTVGGGAVALFRAAWEPVSGWFTALWEGIRAPFDTVVGGILGTIERVQAAFTSLRGNFAGATAAGGPAVVGNMQQRQAEAAAARAAETHRIEQLAMAGGGGRAAQPISGEILVRAAPGTEIVSATGSNNNVPVTAAPNTGATRGRP